MVSKLRRCCSCDIVTFLKAGEGGNLEFDEVLVRVAADAQLVLSEQIRHSILQVTQV